MHDEHLAVAAALDAFQCEKPLAEAMTAAAMPSDDEVDAVLKLCGWLSDTRHDAERRRQIRSSFRRTIHEAFRLGVEAARRPQPEPHSAMPDFWSVDVHVDAERLVSIGHNWLSGKELGQAEERAIIGAAQHLLAFVGFGLPRPDFDPDADEAAAHGAVTGELAAHQPSASSAAARPSAELADYHGPDDTPHPVLLALSEHDNPCEDTAEALARIAALRTEIDSLRAYLQRAQARAEAQAGNVEATVQASPGYPLLAKKHTGSRVNYRGLLGQCQSILRRHGGGGYAEILRQLEGHIKQLGERWYAGDTAVVDEMLQLYCVESQLREALSLNFAEHKGDVALLESPAAAREPRDPMDWPLPCDVTVGHGTMRKGVALRTLINRMKVLYRMATGRDADEVAARTLEHRTALAQEFLLNVAQPPSTVQAFDTQAAPSLHPRTAALVHRFSEALAAKLGAAELKHGYSDGWASNDWMDECRAKLMECLHKGDPCDVAAHCAFLWHHGESTSAAVAPDCALTLDQVGRVVDAVIEASTDLFSSKDGVKIRYEPNVMRTRIAAALARRPAAEGSAT